MFQPYSDGRTASCWRKHFREGIEAQERNYGLNTELAETLAEREESNTICADPQNSSGRSKGTWIALYRKSALE